MNIRFLPRPRAEADAGAEDVKRTTSGMGFAASPFLASIVIGFTFLGSFFLPACAEAGESGLASDLAVTSDSYLVAVELDAGHTLAQVAALGARARHVAPHVTVAETDRHGLVALREAGYVVKILDHPIDRDGYTLLEDHERRGLSAGVTRGAVAVWRDGPVSLYRGLPLDRFAGIEGSHDFHVSRLPASIPLDTYLAHPPPPLIARVMAEPGGLVPLTSTAALAGLEERLAEHMSELSYNDTTDTYRSRYAYRIECRDHAAEYIRNAYLDALDGHGEVTFMSGFRCGHPDSISIAPNVIARLPGRGRGKIIVSAHYDAIASRTPGWDSTVDPAPGADDNASGVAATIEILRLLAPLDFDFELIAASWACEEILPEALWGSRAYAESADVRGDSIWAVVNLDMLGNNPAEERLDILTNTGSHWIADLLLSVGPPAEWPGRIYTQIHLERPYSDHNSFWDHSYDAITIDENVDVRATNPDYHRVTDTDGTKRMGQVTTAVRMVAGAISALGNRPDPDLALATGSVRLNWAGFPLDQYPDIGQPVTVTATLRNLGRRMDDTRNVRVDFFSVDVDRGERAIDSQTVPLMLLLGEESTVTTSWVVPDDARGNVSIGARLVDLDDEINFDTANDEASADVVVDGDGFEIFDVFGFPNPVTDSSEFRLHFQLSESGYVRVTVRSLTGETVAERTFYDTTGLSADRMRVGVNEITWEQIAGSVPFPASGLYLVQLDGETPAGARTSGSTTFAIRR